MTDADYLFALELQKRLNGEHSEASSDPEEVEAIMPPPLSKTPLRVGRSKANDENDFLNQTQNLVHPQWEILDPTPDIHALFGAFDAKFFQGRLKCVTLEWSKRMYSCAGICYSRKNRFGMQITIRLSEPLLKLRPRKNLVETMLHEMIHAYCFALNIREGNGGHGPNFKKIMNTINQVAGTNITVYHTFHDEVALYKQHVWRCNGICQHRAPFFGFVKRTSNRAPGPNDQWWAAHKESCGGYFQKIQEPEKKKSVTSKKTSAKPAGTGDLRKYFDSTKTTNNKKTDDSKVKGLGGMLNSIKGPIKTNGGGTLLLNPKTKNSSNTSTSADDISSIAKAFPPTSYPGLSSDPFNIDSTKKPARPLAGGNLSNVLGFRDLANADSGGNGVAGRAISGTKPTSEAMTGRGYSLDGPSSISQTNNTKSASTEGQVDRNHLRNVWAKRFEKPANDSTKPDDNKESLEGDAKRRRISVENKDNEKDDDIVFVADEQKASWNVLDDDIMIRDIPNDVITLSSDDDSDDDVKSVGSTSPIPLQRRTQMTADERQTIIKKEILDDTDDLNDEDIVLIDDEYDDAQDSLDLSAAVELADTSLIDEFFGDDTLMKEFRNENDVVPSGSRHKPNPADDIISCPICQQKLQRKFINEHLDGCTGIVVRVKAPVHQLKKLPMPEALCARKKPRKSKKQILRDAGYTEEDLFNITSSSGDENDFNLDTSSSQVSLPSTSDDNRPKTMRQRGIYKETRQCPVCYEEVPDDDINAHLDECLAKRREK